MSTTSSGSGSGGRSRVAPAKLTRASSSTVEHVGRRRRRARGCPSTNSSAFSASRAAEVAQNRIVGDVVLAHDLHVLLDGGEDPLQRGIRDPAGAVDALAEPDDAHLADQRRRWCRRRRRGRRPAAAASWCRSRRRRRGSWGLLRESTVDAGAGLATTHRAASSTSSPSGFTPAPLGQRLAGEDVQALDPVGHAAGGDARDLGHLADRRRARRGRPRAPGGTPPRAPRPRRGARSSRASAPTPRASRSARPRADRSGRRSSGTGCRRRAAARSRPRRGCRTGTGAPTAWIDRGGRPSCAATTAASRSDRWSRVGRGRRRGRRGDPGRRRRLLLRVVGRLERPVDLAPPRLGHGRATELGSVSSSLRSSGFPSRSITW